MEAKGVCALRRAVVIQLAFLVLWAVCLEGVSAAWFWEQKPLVTINGVEYTADDFRSWWEKWREGDQPPPETPDEFIEWQLMAQEAEKMQLDQEPTFKRKVDTFLKVRSLMMLKAEEVDSKIEISDQKSWQLYLDEYNPRWRLHIFVFNDQETAAGYRGKLERGEVDIADVAAEVGSEGGPAFYQEKVVRAPKLEEQWREALKDVPVGGFCEPFATHGKFVLIRLEEVLAPDREDFAQVRGGILEKLRKQETARLTGELVERLKKKYELSVDQELLDGLKNQEPGKEEAARVLIHTNQQAITLGEFWAQLEKERKFRRKFHFEAREFEELKQWVLGNIITQTLVSWESLNRHYEQRPPLQDLYAFYRRHRLVKEFERRFVHPKVTLTEEEAKGYYDQHQEEYLQPATVTFAQVSGEEEFMNKFWSEIQKGRDFFVVAKELLPAGAVIRQVPLNHVQETVKKELDQLAKGETSRPFKEGGAFTVLKLIGRTEATPVPFEQVRGKIEEKLKKEKYRQARQDLLRTLKERSAIMVDEKQWSKVRKELAEEERDETKNG